MFTHLAPKRGWATALLALLSIAAGPTWAACNGQTTAKIDPLDQTVPESVNGVRTVVQLNGASSTPKSGDLQFRWRFVSSTVPVTVTLNNPNSAIANFTVPDVPASGAALTFELRTTCNNQSVATTVINVTDVVMNAPPTASFFISPLDASEGQTVTLDATGSSDPDGQALTYDWVQTGGPEVTLVNGPNQGGSIKTFVAPNLLTTTTFTFKLTVSDGFVSDTQEKGVNVVWANDPPVAALTCPAVGVLNVDEGQSVTFDASGSSDSEGAITYAWSQSSGLPYLGIGGLLTPSITFAAPSLGYNQLGGMTVTVTVTDAQGASASKSCGLFIRDVTAPVITVPADITAEALSPSGANVSYAVVSQDAVQDESPQPLACVPPSGSLFPLDVWTTVECADQDANNNLAHANFRIFVDDTTAPTLTVPGPTAVEADGPNGSVATFDATSSDLVDGEEAATCAPPSGSLFPLGDTVVECSATDAHGNAAAHQTFTITVMDTRPPVIAPHDNEGPVEATSAAGAAVSYVAPSWTDAVSGSDSATCLPASGSTFALGTTTVECNAQDEAGNHAEPVTFTVEVVDTTAPVIVKHSNILGVEATGPGGASVVYVAPSWTDAVSGSGSATCLPASGSTFALGTTTVHCSATDGASNTGYSEFTVTVVDTTAPTLSLPADITAEATGPGGASVTWTASASDLVDGGRTVSCVPASGSTFALGVTTVDCSASDTRGNTAHGSFNVTVQDTTAPVIATPADVTATATANSQAVVTYTDPTASDVVDGTVAVKCTPASGSTFNIGTTAVTCTATDAHGNKATSTFNVIVSYAFGGFLRPVDNLPTVNVVKAGQAIPVKFSLGGNQGLAIFAAGYPKVVAMACSGAMQDAVEETMTAGGSSLQYDAATGQYIYVWKSEKSWAGSCRQLQVKFADGTTQFANFSFTR
jgi:hypothetical protein